MKRPLRSRMQAILFSIWLLSSRIGCCSFGKPAVAAEPAAEDVYYLAALDKLKYTDEQGQSVELLLGEDFAGTDTRAALEIPGEIYIGFQWRKSEHESGLDLLETVAAIRAPMGKPVTGTVYIIERQDSPYAKPASRQFHFELPAEGFLADRRQFLEIKRKHYEELRRAASSGTAWFRHQEFLITQELAKNKQPETWVDREEQRQQTLRAEFSHSRSFSLFSGGRAISENLQLDRTLPLSKADAEEININSLNGITIAEIDWQPLIKDSTPAVDPLAKSIPADQHAIFFPTFEALLKASDFADQEGSLPLGLAESRSESAMSRERYETQLCLPMNALVRLLGPKTIKSVAITGGDLYFRTGTDVAVLFEAVDGKSLRALVEARLMLGSLAKLPTAKPERSEVAGISYFAVRNSERTICSYVASVGNIVIVTNSLVQLERLVETASGMQTSLATLPEYTFFRDRYKRGEEGEVALAILSDATIRRWCGPKWRIAASRRTRAEGVLGELQADLLDALVKGNVTPGPLTPEFALGRGTNAKWNHWGVSSPVYGSLAFNTPIQELDLEKVTRQEAEFYDRWRQNYQNRWRQFFDPIAVQLKLQDNRVTMDLTVMPLIVGSEYSYLADLSAGATLKPLAGDLHPESLFHLALVLNKETEQSQNILRALESFTHIDPEDWLGDTVAFYADQGTIWQEAAAAPQREEFMKKNFHRLPVVVNIETTDEAKSVAFMKAAKAVVQSIAPEMTTWENKEYTGRKYGKIVFSKTLRDLLSNEIEDLALYYATGPNCLVFSFHEATLQRVLDRQIALAKAKDAGEELPLPEKPWIAGNLGVQVRPGVVQMVEARGDYQKTMQRLAWSNLPILNEWKRLYPDHSPLQFHEKYWHRRLLCPGGGEYVWNEKWRTMESTVYGHPGEPKQGPPLSARYKEFDFGNFGLTFENGGVRAAMELDRKPKSSTEQ